MTDIFISYASKDRERLRPLRQSLEARGWSVFWDEETPVGKNWRRSIFEKLRTARCVIVAWSQASIESDWVSEEAADALKRDILLPVFIESVEPPFGFADVQAMNLVDWNGAEDAEPFRRLVDEVTKILGAGPKILNKPPPATGRAAAIDPPGRRRMIIVLGAVLAVAAGTVLWIADQAPETTASVNEATDSQAPDVRVGGDGIAVGRDLNQTGDIKFGD